MSSFRQLSGIAFVLFLPFVLFAGEIDKVRNVESDAGKKVLVSFSKGDSEIRIGGLYQVDHLFYNNAVLLNKNVPDQAEIFKQTLDLIFHFGYGEKKFGYEAVQFHAELRNKNKWGTTGAYVESMAGEVKIKDVKLPDHKHVSTRPLIWFRTGWIQFGINSLFSINSDKLHFLKFGWFPFKLGRGISFGSNYGATKVFLGIYSQFEEKYAPGILLTGELVKDHLKYDIYYSKMEEKGASIGDTFNTKKSFYRNRATNPWSGVAKDNDLIAGRLLISFNDKKWGRIELEPYALYDEASDQKVEFAADSKSQLGTFGLGIEYKKNGFEFGCEGAFNVGHEKLKSIDRNVAIFERWDNSPQAWGSGDSTNFQDAVEISNNGLLREVQSYVNKGNNRAPVYPDSETYVIESRYNLPLSSPGTFSDKPNRFRNSYKNDYRGWFVVVDSSYYFADYGVKIAGAYGYVSGDVDPHEVEKDKNYDDFVGLNEWYAGKRVVSLFLLADRSLPIPMSLTANTTSMKIDSTFSNLQHVGYSIQWQPVFWKKKKVLFRHNLLGFWKVANSLKYDINKAYEKNKYSATLADGRVENENAGKYLGLELSFLASFEPLPDLIISTDLSFFVPGDFYKDLKGVPLASKDSNVFSAISNKVKDQYNIHPAGYRLGDSTAFFWRIGVKYSF